jgi:hypothetical protein
VVSLTSLSKKTQKIFQFLDEVQSPATDPTVKETLTSAAKNVQAQLKAAIIRKWERLVKETKVRYILDAAIKRKWGRLGRGQR